jgi:metal-sulfur cluster biosynthetic enzyme
LENSGLFQAVNSQLQKVIDPETGLDVLRMHLVRDIAIDPVGKVSYIFRPSSVLCPIALPLALNIIKAVSIVPGVTGQTMMVKDHIQADELNQILRMVLE